MGFQQALKEGNFLGYDFNHFCYGVGWCFDNITYINLCKHVFISLFFDLDMQFFWKKVKKKQV